MKVFSILAALVAVATVGAQSFDELVKLDRTYAAAKKAFDKSPKDAKLKEKFIVAGVKFGHASMMAEALPPKVRYPQALRIYRQVLRVDPKNPVAKQESDLIIDIYKKMGRPVPN